jgi:hypothetical protein
MSELRGAIRPAVTDRKMVGLSPFYLRLLKNIKPKKSLSPGLRDFFCEPSQPL